MKKFRYLFGPVPSRRFGRSLGVDLTPLKTCSFNCVFCQLGRTEKNSCERKEYVPIDLVTGEIELWLGTGETADYITLSGSGEPTLHSGFENVLKLIEKSKVPSVLLTNGSTLDLPEVRDAASAADIVKVSLSAWDQLSFERINRPHENLKFRKIIDGLKVFREQYNGQLWIEVFLLFGMNSMPEQVKKIAAVLKEIKPDRIHLNTVVRPPAEDFASALSKDRMESFTGLFNPAAEIISGFSIDCEKNVQANEETIFSMLKRRPCTIEQISEGFGLHINEVSKYLGKLMQSKQIHTIFKKTDVYYLPTLNKENLTHV